jgi:3-keto-L-gulonate-6-phosphate decarboxylase
MEITVQISLDFISIAEALETARLALRAGVDWLEAGTPLIIRAPEFGAALVVLGAPLTIDANAFRTATGDLEDRPRLVCDKHHAYRT